MLAQRASSNTRINCYFKPLRRHKNAISLQRWCEQGPYRWTKAILAVSIYIYIQYIGRYSICMYIWQNSQVLEAEAVNGPPSASINSTLQQGWATWLQINIRTKWTFHLSVTSILGGGGLCPAHTWSEVCFTQFYFLYSSTLQQKSFKVVFLIEPVYMLFFY